MTIAKLMKRAANLPRLETIDADKKELAMRLATFDVENLRRKIAATTLRIDNAQREAKRFGEIAKEARTLAYDGKKLINPDAALCATAIEKVAQRYASNVKTWEKDLSKLRSALAKAHNLIVAVDCGFESCQLTTVTTKPVESIDAQN